MTPEQVGLIKALLRRRAYATDDAAEADFINETIEAFDALIDSVRWRKQRRLVLDATTERAPLMFRIDWLLSDVPPDLAACESVCPHTTCTDEQWQTCEVRMGVERAEEQKESETAQ